MKHLKIVLSAILLALSINANATILTFDDVPGGSVQNNFSVFGASYKGFDISSTLVWIDVVDSTRDFGAHSGDFAILNNYPNAGFGTITESTSADFTFDGLWAKRWGTDPDSGGTDSLFGFLRGYNDGVLVWDIATSLNGSYEFYGAQTGLIDELVINMGRFYLVDDIELNVSAVPVPAAAWLFGSALLGFFGFSRRKANA